MGANRFSNFRNEGGVTLSGKTMLFRKVGHSTSNWFKSKRSTSKMDKVKSVGKSAITDGAGLAGAGVAIFSVAASVTTGVVAIVGGPVSAIAAGIVTLGFLAKGAYSNRDGAHAKLLPYVYSIIDDMAPRVNIYTNAEGLKEAATAAAYLMKEAPSQYKTMASKLQTREDTFKKFWKDYEKEISMFTGGQWKGIQGKMDQYERIPPGQRSENMLIEIVGYHEFLNKAKVKSEGMWERQSKQGGAVFEFMRRLVKVGNYLQCASIVSLATYNEVGIQRSEGAESDPFKQWQTSIDYRKYIQEMSDFQSEADINYRNWDAFAQKNGVK